MASKNKKNMSRKARQSRVRKLISGTEQKPRLNIFRSNKYIYANVIDDISGNTLVAASSLEPAIKAHLEHTANKDAAKAVGEQVAKRAIEKGIDTVVFDRAGYLYHGKVKELAESARAAGLKF